MEMFRLGLIKQMFSLICARFQNAGNDVAYLKSYQYEIEFPNSNF